MMHLRKASEEGRKTKKNVFIQLHGYANRKLFEY